MASEKWLDRSVLDWLETLLKERFGHKFELSLTARKSVILGREDNDSVIIIASDPSAFTQSDPNLPMSSWDAATEGFVAALGKPLPAPGKEELPSPLIEAHKNGFRIGYDILGLCFWMLTRQEEIGRTDLDEHGRFPASSSHAYKHGYLERPIVDEWLDILGQVISRQWPELELTCHRFSMKPSHDVDRPSLYAFCRWSRIVRLMASHLFRRGDLKECLNAPRVRMLSNRMIHSNDPFNTFDWLMDISERYGFRSAYYFICGRTDAIRDSDYEIEHPAMTELMFRAFSRGHEIGLHPSYNTFDDPAELAREAQRLRDHCELLGIEQSAWGGRMHYLRWRQPTTLQAWHDADMTYDSSLGYADRPGFRGGTCFEYPAFNPLTRQQLTLRIRPLILMECTVLDPAYMNLAVGAASFEKITDIMEACRAVNGCFTLLWHNSYLATPELRRLYEDIFLHAQSLTLDS